MNAGAKYPLMTRAEHDMAVQTVRECHKGAVVQSWAWGYIWGLGSGIVLTSVLFVGFLYAAMQVY